MSLIPLFATPIYSAPCLPSKSKLLREIKDEAVLLAGKDRPGKEWSLENYQRGYTSYGSLDQLHRFSSTFHELKDRLDPHVATFVKALGLQVPAKDIRLTRMWVNLMGQGCSHPMHLHPLSIISGTFYVQTPKQGSAIRFEDPRSPLFMARPLAKAPPRQASPLIHAHSPKPGEVVLFESWLRHDVPAHPLKEKRISVSFNYDWISG